MVIFGQHGTDGWYYGSCEWDGKGFAKLPYDKENNRYYDNGKPELKADFVEPGNGKNAAYKWVVAKDGTISVKGTYTKFANSDDSNADGTTFRLFLNGEEKVWRGNETKGNFGSEKTESFEEEYEVKAGDILIFAVNPEGNDSFDGGRLTVTIKDVTPEPESGEGKEEKPSEEQPAAPAESGETSGDNKEDKEEQPAENSQEGTGSEEEGN